MLSQVMTAVGAACRRAVMEADPRLVEAMYLCQLQASAEALSGEKQEERVPE